MNPADKPATRRALLDARRALPPDVRAQAQAALDAHLLEPTRPWFSPRCTTVAVYAALPDEASLARLTDRLSANGVVVAFPRVGGGRLAFCACTAAELVPAPFGLMEPPPGYPELPLDRFDLFLVPGVGFTESGRRIGYGRGYYDRALAEAGPRPARVGVGFEVQLCPALPLEPHDQPLDGLVTERGFRWRSDDR